MEDLEVDVVVAGIGIAGSFTLRALKNVGKEYKVLGIDKRSVLGFPVECGELVPTKEEMKSLLPNLGDYSLFDLPKKFVSNVTHSFNFVIPNGDTYKVDFDMLVINRDKFIQSVANTGHEVWLRTRVVELNSNVLKVEDLENKRKIEIKSKVIVASDGANSRIAKCLGVWNYEVAAAKQYVMDGVDCDEKTVYMFVGSKIAPGGYAWIIPKGDGIANVGVGIRQSFLREGDSIHKVLDRFVRDYPHSSKYLRRAKILRKIGAVAPVDKPLNQTVFGNVVFVGDSASMILSHVAAGIPISMIAGDIAGKVIAEYLKGKTKLEEYDRLWRDKMMDAISRSYKIKQLWDKISGTDDRLCKYFKFISNRDIATILRSKIPLKLKLAEPFIPLINSIV